MLLLWQLQHTTDAQQAAAAEEEEETAEADDNAGGQQLRSVEMHVRACWKQATAAQSPWH